LSFCIKLLGLFSKTKVISLVLIKKLIGEPFLVAFIISLLSTPLTIKLARRFRLVDDPANRCHPAHTHQGTVPRAGGLPIFLSLTFTSLLFLPLDKHLKGILFGAALLIIVGLLDDRFDLNPYFRLFTCFLAAGMVVIAGIGIAFINNPFNGIIHLDQPRIYFEFLGKTRSIWVLANFFALFWIVWMANIVNWAKGFDGQLPGIATIAALTIALLSFRFSADVTQWPVTILAAITAGAYFGFLPFNFYPQKIMPGYGGGTLAGFMLAVLAILSTTKIGTAIVVLGVPVIDAVYSIARRIAAGRSPVWGDRGHLHHKLLDEWRWGKRRTAIFYWLVTALLGAVALSLNSSQKFYTIIMIAVAIGGVLLWLNFFTTWRSRPDQDRQ
jgi:UDP-GlcNAc:undecaprenyl-phosphate GlcNAc-1-phosphate transferase